MTSNRPSDDTPSTQFSGSDTSNSAFGRLLHEAAKVSSATRVLAAGARLGAGRFEIRRRLGEGGMGVVFEAFDNTRQERVALKTMSRVEARNIYQFKNEFRALADVAHPNLVSLHELSADGDLWFFTMELVEGQRFDHWLASSRERLPEALAQLILAVAEIHRAGKLHRDLKPSNVLVTSEGRVVVLDFGLAVTPHTGGVGQTMVDASVSGTPAYMAPEQAAGRSATAASDWYAVGVMLFEVLTGRLPFMGSAEEILVDKQRSDAPKPSQLLPSVPSDLDELCGRLLAREPSLRPNASELSVLFPPVERDGSASQSKSSLNKAFGRGDSLAPETAPELLGRDTELQLLREAFELTLTEQAVVVFVSGESGMGKSALCETFLHELHVQGRGTLLKGRCYERENVPYKGFDSLVDDLSRHLRKLPSEEAAALLPRDVSALTRLFPVLARVKVVADAPQKDISDPVEQRRRAFAAFGKLLARLRDRGPLCITLDDVQWLDADAVLFLRALLVHPEPVPLLLILSHRSENAEQNSALLSVRDAIEGNTRWRLERLPVAPLSEQAVSELAQRLLSKSQADTAAAANIARESAGSPFFAGELARFVERHAGDASVLASLSFGAALRDHLAALAQPARRLIEHSALVGKPLPAKLLLEAAQAGHGDLDRLRSARLLKLSNLDGGRVVECYHDKVRETVAESLSELVRVSCYAGLAGALEAHAHPDPELLATCFEGAGQRAVAAEHYVRAAEQAMASTAFLQAARLYERALAIGHFDPERVHRLTVLQGDALTEAGRSKQAAELFLRAAPHMAVTEGRALRRRAAEGLVITGHAEQGMALYQELFAELGKPLPASSGAAIRHLLWAQLHLRLRGLDHVSKPTSACSGEDRELLELYWSAHRGVGIASPLIAAGLDLDYLLYALKLGVSEHVTYSLAYSTINLGFVDPSPRMLQNVERALELAREVAEPRLLADIEMKAGMAHSILGLWQPAREHFARALPFLRHSLREVQFVRDNLNWVEHFVAFASGDWLHLRASAPGLVEQAYSRDRVLAGIMLSVWSYPAWLSGDDVAGYRRMLARGTARWQPGSEARYPDVALAWGQAELHLYCQEPEQALSVIDSAWTWVKTSPVARAQLSSILLLHTRGMAALAVLRATGDSAARAIVRDSAKRLSRLDLPYRGAMRETLEAGLALALGKSELGAKHLGRAIAGFDEHGMPLYAAAARRRLGQLLDGDEGQQLLVESERVMLAQCIANQDAITETLCAGCGAP